MNTCDIIIPTYNDSDSISLVLEAISLQDIPARWSVRVVVCDDGSSDGGSDIAKDFRGNVPVVIVPGAHAGAAAARNRGISFSHADVLLFLDADIILRPGALEYHLALHEQETSVLVGGLGFVVWDPRLKPTPLMEWMSHGGPQNNFDALLGEVVASPAEFFYGAHVSVKRAAVAKEMFGEEFTQYGHEDHDLGVRLARSGMELRVLHKAVGLHRSFYSAHRFFKRQRAVGAGEHILAGRLYGGRPAEEGSLLRRMQLLLYVLGPGALLRAITAGVSTRWTIPRIFAHSARYEYFIGLLHNKTPTYPQVYPQ